MTYMIEKLPDENIIVVTYTVPFDIQQDTGGAITDTGEMLEGMTPPVLRVSDFSTARLDFSQIVVGMASSIEKKPGAVGDERLIDVLVGTVQELGTIVANGYRQEQYGSLSVQYFTSMDEALNVGRQLLAESTP